MNYAETVHKKSLVAYIAFPDDQETISLKRVKSFYWDRVLFCFVFWRVGVGRGFKELGN